MTGATQADPQAIAAPSLLPGDFWQSPDIELSMPDIMAISDAMPLACTADKFMLKVTRTASKNLKNRRADEWIIASSILGIASRVNKPPAPCDPATLPMHHFGVRPGNSSSASTVPRLDDVRPTIAQKRPDFIGA